MCVLNLFSTLEYDCKQHDFADNKVENGEKSYMDHEKGLLLLAQKLVMHTAS